MSNLKNELHTKLLKLIELKAETLRTTRELVELGFKEAYLEGCHFKVYPRFIYAENTHELSSIELEIRIKAYED